MRDMTRRMAVGGNRGDAGHDILARLVGVTLLPSAPNTRLIFLKLPSTMALPVALLISPSSFQNFHSPAGTRISAFGNAGLLSAVIRPLM